MYTKNNVLLGVCPIGKFVFSHEDAIRQKNAIFKRLSEWHVNYISVDEVLPDDQGLVRNQNQVQVVVDYLKEKHIDALFIPHCNFGTEGAAGMIAKKMGVPVLLWGPRDEAPLKDGTRYRDSLCGLFATSKVLYKLKVPYTYIENCRIDNPIFQKKLNTFLRAASVVKALKKMKIGQIGVRIDFFWSTIDNESELLQKFGIEIIPFDMADFIRTTRNRAKKNWENYQKEINLYKSDWLITEGLESEDGLIYGLAMRDELFALAEEYNLDAFTIKSFSSLQDEFGAGIGIGDMLVQEKFPIGAESDIHGAISSVLLEAASKVHEPSFFPEFTIRHPENDNAILLWHASHPRSLRSSSVSKIQLYPPWILKGLPPSNFKMLLKDGPLTVCRFDGETGDYYLGFGQGHSVNGPETMESWVWMEVDNWLKWERQIIEGPYVHHCSAIYDHCADALEEACKYIPGIKAQRFDS
jgi:L-fucose isomerase-like protein